jgi:hypothetical protein
VRIKPILIFSFLTATLLFPITVLSQDIYIFNENLPAFAKHDTNIPLGDEIRLTPVEAATTSCPAHQVHIRHNYLDEINGFRNYYNSNRREDYDYYVCENTLTGQQVFDDCVTFNNLFDPKSTSNPQARESMFIHQKFICAVGIDKNKHWDLTSLHVSQSFLDEFLSKYDFKTEVIHEFETNSIETSDAYIIKHSTNHPTLAPEQIEHLIADSKEYYIKKWKLALVGKHPLLVIDEPKN